MRATDSSGPGLGAAKAIKVFVRCRPLLESERKKGIRSTLLECDTRGSKVDVKHSQPDGTGGTTRSFPFDGVFEGPDQNKVFEEGNFVDMVRHVLDGYHATVFAYGQTGSGKTYTMEGYDYKAMGGVHTPRAQFSETDNDKLGIIPRLIHTLYRELDAKKKALVAAGGSEAQLVYKVSCNYVQIYNERVYDLLRGPVTAGAGAGGGMGAGLKLRWTKLGGFFVENLFDSECGDANDLMDTFHSGIRHKKMSAHNLNAASSRSHCMFTINVTMTDTEQPENSMSSKLCLVDLAGSERISATGTLEGPAVTFNESVSINKSLFTLRKVITALCDAQKKKGSAGDAHVPFRDSKLTSLLAHSLGGNSYTVMVACLSPADSFMEENLSTLNYAGLAKSIVNMPTRNEDPRNKLIRELREEVKFLRGQIEHLKQVYVVEGGAGGAVRPVEVGTGGTLSAPSSAREIVKTLVPSAPPARPTDGAAKNPKTKALIAGGLDNLDAIGEKLVDSVRMINDLVSANNGLRQRYDGVLGDRERFEKKNNVLMYENSELRQKVEMMESVLANEHRSVWTREGSRGYNTATQGNSSDAENAGPVSLARSRSDGVSIQGGGPAMAGSYSVGARSLRELTRYGTNFSGYGVRTTPRKAKSAKRTGRQNEKMDNPATRQSEEFHHDNLPNGTEVNIDIGGGLTLSVNNNDSERGGTPRSDGGPSHNVRVHANDALKWNMWTPGVQRMSTTGKFVRPPTAPSHNTDVIHIDSKDTDMNDVDKLTTLLQARASLSRDHIRCTSAAL